MDEKEVIEHIDKWFKDNLNNKNKWNREAIGRCLVRNLNMTGNWKNAQRGNPSRGYKKRMENLARENNGGYLPNREE